jgi:uncharacterized protein (TIGR02266 family)
MTEDNKKAAPPRPPAPSAPKMAPPRPAPPLPRASDRHAAVAKVEALVEDEVELIDDPSIAPPPLATAPHASGAPTARTSGAVAVAPRIEAAPVVSAPPPVVISAPPPVVPSPPVSASPILAPIPAEPTLPVAATSGAAPGANVTAAPAAPAEEGDSRSSRRFPFEINVDIVSEHNFYAGLSLNISEGGLFVATHVEYPIGARLEIRLLLPGDDEPTSIMTEVRWVRPHNENADGSAGMGLKFLNLAPDVLAKVHRFAENRDPLYYEDD